MILPFSLRRLRHGHLCVRILMNWHSVSWIDAIASWFLVLRTPWIELPVFSMRLGAIHGAANSWSFASNHAALGNSLRALSLAFSIFSMKIPYPVVGSFMRTCVTAPTSLPFWMILLSAQVRCAPLVLRTVFAPRQTAEEQSAAFALISELLDANCLDYGAARRECGQ